MIPFPMFQLFRAAIAISGSSGSMSAGSGGYGLWQIVAHFADGLEHRLAAGEISALQIRHRQVVFAAGGAALLVGGALQVRYGGRILAFGGAVPWLAGSTTASAGRTLSPTPSINRPEPRAVGSLGHSGGSARSTT